MVPHILTFTLTLKIVRTKFFIDAKMGQSAIGKVTFPSNIKLVMFKIFCARICNECLELKGISSAPYHIITEIYICKSFAWKILRITRKFGQDIK
jgi:hypothetical protein